MRVRILKECPASYGREGRAFLVGRVYNLAAPLASALLLDGCAELYDTLTPAEKRERSEEAARLVWTADDRQAARWFVPDRSKKKRSSS